MSIDYRIVSSTILFALLSTATPQGLAAQACCEATSGTTFSCSDVPNGDNCTNSPTQTFIPLGSCPTACDDLAACCTLAGPCIVSNSAICTIINQGVWMDGTTCMGDPCSMPVELTSFTATVARRDVTLFWNTASETDNAGFEVEHEVGTGLWENIGFVSGMGTTELAEHYRFTIDEVEPGLHPFRLKQIDFDGAYAFSPVVEVAVGVPDRFLLEPAYPNPFNPTTTIRFAVAERERVSLSLYSASGLRVRVLFDGIPDANSLVTAAIDGTGLASGTYQVRLEARGFSVSQSIVLAK